MENFKILEKNSEVRLQVSGETLEGLFACALAGMSAYLNPEAGGLKKNDLKERQRIKVEAPDLSSLLLEFLSKILSETDLKGTVFRKIFFEKFGENFLEGKIFGTKIESLEKEVKAISLEGVDIKRNSETGLYETALRLEI